MADSQEKVQKFRDMMKVLFLTRDEDITCSECFADLDIYVDKLRQGEDPAKVLPQVQRHLDQCSCCRGEFEMLRDMLEAQNWYGDT